MSMAHGLQDFDDLTEGDPEVREVLDSSPAAGYDPWDVSKHGAPIRQSEHRMVSQPVGPRISYSNESPGDQVVFVWIYSRIIKESLAWGYLF